MVTVKDGVLTISGHQRFLTVPGVFALQFALICVVGNLLGDITWGLQTRGPAYVWSWAVGGAFQLSVALSIAELSSAFPVPGACYGWLRRLSHNSLAWIVGYLLLFGYIAALADDDSGLATSVFSVAGLRHPTSEQIAFGALVCLGAQTGLSLTSLRIAARSVALSVALQVLVVVGVLAGLAIAGLRHGPSLLLIASGTTTHEHLPPFLLVLLIPAWTITGFDAAGNFAADMRRPARTAPRALMAAAGASFVLGTALIIVPLLATSNLGVARRAPAALPFLLETRLGSDVSIFFNAAVITALFFLPVVLLLAASRLLAAQARDGAWLGRVSLSTMSRQHVPIRATLLCSGLAGLLSLVWPVFYGLGTAWPALWPLAYAVTIAAGLRAKLKGRLPPERGWKLGRWGILNDVLAIVWSVFLVGLLPLFDVVHAVPLLALIVVAGVLGYLLVIKPRWSPAAVSGLTSATHAPEPESVA